MPTVYIIDGIKINIYANEHAPPHFHAIYAEYEALIAIYNFEILKGVLPKNQLKKVKFWGEAQKSGLLRIFNELNPNL